MYICKKSHEEIVHDSWSDCPVCKIKEKHETELEEIRFKMYQMRAKYEEGEKSSVTIKHKSKCQKKPHSKSVKSVEKK